MWSHNCCNLSWSRSFSMSYLFVERRSAFRKFHACSAGPTTFILNKALASAIQRFVGDCLMTELKSYSSHELMLSMKKCPFSAKYIPLWCFARLKPFWRNSSKPWKESAVSGIGVIQAHSLGLTSALSWIRVNAFLEHHIGKMQFRAWRPFGTKK